jgi:hypothetical protein
MVLLHILPVQEPGQPHHGEANSNPKPGIAKQLPASNSLVAHLVVSRPRRDSTLRIP